MKRLVVFLGLMLATGAFAQQHAVIVSDVEHFAMQSVSSGTLTVSRTVEVFDDDGLPEAAFRVYTDRAETLTALRGVITFPGGRTVKIKKTDLTTISLATGLAEDGFLTAYIPAGNYPFTVSYDYTVQYRKGFAVFPAFAPVGTEKTILRHGEYRISLPKDTRIQYCSVSFAEPEITESQYKWTLDDYGGYTDEHLMPPSASFLPLVLASPIEFMYGGIPGRQGDWKDLGLWQASLLQGVEDLPPETVRRVAEMTAGCSSDLEKIRVLYGYLREKTRYVSIQFGIGGFRPFPASQVDRTGFGDCKALSNYFRCLLRAAGIESDYAILNTTRAHTFPDYASFGQTNHVMVAVPLAETADTLYIECTNPAVPLGYRHRNVAGHDVILISPEGGTLIQAPAYPDSLRRTERDVAVTLNGDGSAHVELSSRFFLDQVEPWIAFRTKNTGEQKQMLASGLGLQPQNLVVRSVRDNFDSYDRRDWCPILEIDYAMDCNNYGRRTGDRLFLPANIFSRKMFVQRGERVNPIHTGTGGSFQDRITFTLPAGYAVESVPDPVQLDDAWCTFSSRVTVDGNRIIVEQCLRLKACDAEKERYADYRSFARALNKACDASIVLKAE